MMYYKAFQVNHLNPAYNLAGAGVLVCVWRSSNVIPHLSRRHNQDKALKYTDQSKRREILPNAHTFILIQIWQQMLTGVAAELLPPAVIMISVQLTWAWLETKNIQVISDKSDI